MTSEMDDIKLNKVIGGRDLGLIIQNDLKCKKQCVKADNTANRVQGMM
jgi:hypothetical protein